MKHTPGPWNVSADKWRITVVDNGHTGIWRLVAECKTPDDASLVAAAPEMFDALEAVMELVNDCYLDVWRNGDHDTQHYCPMCGSHSEHNDGCPIPLVKIVIAKAKGTK